MVMSMADEYLATVTLPHASGIVADSVVNTFPIQAFPGWDPAVDLIEVTAPISQFYNRLAGVQVSAKIGAEMSRAALGCLIKLYDISPVLGGGAMGSPVATDAFTLGASDGTGPAFPTEVACVLTTRGSGWEGAAIEAPDGADPGALPDRPRSRRSGRIFVGPVHSGAHLVDANGSSRPSPTFMTILLESAEATVDALAAGGHEWAVWSRVDADLRNVTAFQVDNAWDTQRRRGNKATSRTTLQV